MERPTEKKKILLIDDEKNLSALLKINIEATTGYEVIVATSGREGIELIKTERPDLVLLDIVMPEMDGFEVLNLIKAIHPQLPVAMVTAVLDENEAKRAFKAGAYEYISKPIHADQLKRAMLVKLL